MTIAVLGAGNWGTTIALLLAGNGHEVHLWEYNESLVLTCPDTEFPMRYG